MYVLYTSVHLVYIYWVQILITYGVLQLVEYCTVRVYMYGSSTAWSTVLYVSTCMHQLQLAIFKQLVQRGRDLQGT